MESWLSPYRPRSLRGQLVGLIAALAIPLVALQIFWSYREFQAAEEAAQAQVLTLADATATSFRQFLTLAEQLLYSATEEYGPAWVTGEDCRPHAETLSRVLPFLVNAVAINPQGEILCAARPVPEGSSAASWSWLPELFSTGRFTIGRPVLGTLSREWILPLAVPVLDDDGAVVGAVVGSLRLLDFDRLLGGTARDADHLVTLANADRVVIARSHDPESHIGNALPPLTGDDREIAPGRWIATGPDFNGTHRSWGQVETYNGWIVYAGVPTATVLAPVRALAAQHLATTLAIIFLGILLAGTSYRRIAGALRELGVSMLPAARGAALELPDATPTEVRAVVERFNDALESRNRAETAERMARERYQSIFDNAVFGLYVSTMEGRFLQVNPALATMLGYESEEALMTSGAAALYPTPSTGPKLTEEAAQLGVIENWEVEWLRADGLPITVRLNGRVIETADGEQALEMIVQDITEERRREDELRQTQKMEAIGKLAGGIAHDFNNLLTVIGGNLELLEDSLPAHHPLRADVGQIMEATERATSLTLQLLAFSRKEPRGARPLDLNETLVNMERMLVRLIGEDVQLETRLSPDPPLISIEPGELEQIVMNLVLNARDAMPTGGQVLISSRPAAIDVGSGRESRTEQGMLLSVQDSGLGMDFETSKRIFEPFYTTKPMGKGTGLGLSTVYGIVQRVGGHLGVESEPGQGTTIDIWFPITMAPARPEQAAPRATGPVGGNESILVVEDEELVRLFVRRALEESGYTVTVACDGQEALETFEAREAPIDLVLTDVVMPRMKGPELAEALAERSPSTPVLYMSGYVHNQVLSGQLADDPDVLLRKPFSTTELCAHVRRVLDKKPGGPAVARRKKPKVGVTSAG